MSGLPPSILASPRGRLGSWAAFVIAAANAAAAGVSSPGRSEPPPQAPPPFIQGPEGLGLAPPPGWQASPRPPDRPDVLFLLEGPPRHSFVLSRFKTEIDAENRAVVRAALTQVVGHVNRRAQAALRPGRGLRLSTLPNGAQVYTMVSAEAGRPALAVGLCRFRGRRLLAVASGKAPEADLRRIVSTLTASGAPSDPDAGAMAPEVEIIKPHRLSRPALWSLEAVLVLLLLWLWRRSRRVRG